MKFAQIVDGKVHLVFESEADPVVARTIQLVAVDGIQPEVEQGDLYDGTTFTKPVVPEPTAQDIARRKAFYVQVLKDLTEQYLNDTAKNTGYKNIDTARLPASVPGKYQQEAIAFCNMYTACWELFETEIATASKFDAEAVGAYRAMLYTISVVLP
jgi:hypothetical protein